MPIRAVVDVAAFGIFSWHIIRAIQLAKLSNTQYRTDPETDSKDDATDEYEEYEEESPPGYITMRVAVEYSLVAAGFFFGWICCYLRYCS